ncbi:alpha/beta hydrolase [Bosea sp. (in: a-proteobacteria)]|uniref:alpha/beta fold hydrolase n=1 Tax=Bosea sp. (in: a-proteobacteria) TaxID=1871050 RepID=UPI002DDD3B07|nr:alpha/beta hydrolase [Bosea sp. (in: a-proteobacteria)]HEV2508043.1 alpha/beta hydrolase [Bosea sp. (in: a-proteobacteria)]
MTSVDATEPVPTHFRTTTIAGTEIFYREAGPQDAPALLLLHGFPSSSHMFRDLIPRLAGQYRVIAPDYPGFGHSGAPLPAEFDYRFDRLADVVEALVDRLGLTSYVLYLQDYGGPVGFRLALRRPERVRGLIVQNAVANAEGWSPEITAPMAPFWRERNAETEKPFADLLKPETTRFQYVHGATRAERLSPDAWTMDQAGLDRPGNREIQLRLLHDYQSNFAAYPAWQRYLTERQPPMLIVWGKNDPFFTLKGVDYLKQQVPGAEVHLFDAGHFALETHADEIAGHIGAFMARLHAE